MVSPNRFDFEVRPDFIHRKMNRHQYWRAEYRQERYLEHVNQDELEERVRDITTNVVSVGPAGQLHPVGARRAALTTG
jgi:hypothetical protein